MRDELPSSLSSLFPLLPLPSLSRSRLQSSQPPSLTTIDSLRCVSVRHTGDSAKGKAN